MYLITLRTSIHKFKIFRPTGLRAEYYFIREPTFKLNITYITKYTELTLTIVFIGSEGSGNAEALYVETSQYMERYKVVIIMQFVNVQYSSTATWNLMKYEKTFWE